MPQGIKIELPTAEAHQYIKGGKREYRGPAQPADFGNRRFDRIEVTENDSHYSVDSESYYEPDEKLTYKFGR